jgi:predicted  nucleic acid-binding Zn-ribbon protein
MTTTEQQVRQQSQADGFTPLRAYGQSTRPVDLDARLAAANQRAAELEEKLAAVTAALDAAEHRAAVLEDRNRELASDLDDALDLASEHALDVDHERLAPTPRYCDNAFAGLSANAFSHTRGGMQR